MTTAVQRRRGTTTEHATFTGLEGEISVNTTKETLVVHDGATAGGFELARADGSNFIASNVDINGGTIDGTSVGASSASTGAFTSLSASGEITANGGIALGDNDKATFGAGDDLQIYHDGGNSYIADAGTGFLQIRTNGTEVSITGNSGAEYMARFLQDSEAQLYYNGAKKLATVATGIDVTGTVVADGLTLDGSLAFGSTIDGVINAPYSVFVNIDTLNNSSGDVFQIGRDATGTGAAKVFTAKENGDVSFYEDTGTTAKMVWDASAESLGIGTSSPSDTLSVVNLGSSGTGVQISSGTSSGDLRFKARTESYNGIVSVYDSGSNEDVRISAHSEVDTYFNSGSNVGIGTSSPTSPLTVKGETLVQEAGANGNAAIRVQYGNDGDTALRDRARLMSVGYSGVLELLNSSNVLTTKVSSNSDSYFNGGSVGIGTSSPQYEVDLTKALTTINQNPTLQVKNSWTGQGNNTGFDNKAIGLFSAGADTVITKIQSRYDSGANVGQIGTQTAHDFLFTTGNAERMRIDASGNSIFGSTVTDRTTADGTTIASVGFVDVSRASAIAGRFTRRSTNGAIIDFRKDGTTVGSIGTASNDLYLGSGVAGLRFREGGPQLMPWNTTTNAVNDNAIDIGKSDARFKDLYLSGGVYLGGTGAANKLDDYEEGTWTPVFAFGGASVGQTYGAAIGSYTKIGNLVTVSAYLVLTALGSSTGNATITGLPFTSGNVGSRRTAGSLGGLLAISFADVPNATMNENSVTIDLLETTNAGNTTALTNGNFANNSGLKISFSYRVA